MWNRVAGCSAPISTMFPPHKVDSSHLSPGTWSISCPDCLQGFLSHIVTPPSGCCCTAACSSWRCYQRHSHLHWWAWPWPVVGQSWSWLVLASLDMGESFQKLLTKATSVVPFHQNPATQMECNLCLTSLQEIQTELLLANRLKTAPQENGLFRLANWSSWMWMDALSFNVLQDQEACFKHNRLEQH